MGVVQELSLIIDAAARRKAEQDAAAAGKTIGTNLERGAAPGMERMLGWAKRLGGALGIAFGISAIVRFGKASVAAANESETAWNDLAITLKNNKTNLQAVRHEVEALGQRALRKTAFGDESAIQSLNRLVQITGNYHLALRAVPAAMDLATAKSIGLDEASKLVGRALAGNTTLLKRMIPELDKTKDILGQVTAKFGGAAEGELLTFGGRIKQLGEWFGELREAIGEVLVTSIAGGSAIDVLTASLQGMTAWVKTNKTELGTLASFITKTLTVAVRELGRELLGIQTVLRFLGNPRTALRDIAREQKLQRSSTETLSAGAGHGGGPGPSGRAGAPAAAVTDVVREIAAAGTLNQQIIAQGAAAAAVAIRTGAELTKGVIADINAQYQAQNTARLAQIAGQASAEDQAIEKMKQGIVDIDSMLAEDRERRKASHVEYLAHLEEQAFRLEAIVGNTLAIADAWGLVSDELGRVLSSLSRAASDAASFAKSLATGDVLGAIGSGINLIGDIGGAIGIKGSKDPERFATNQAMYERAIQGDEAALEFLRTHSVVSQNGSVGWGSGKAAADAATKYAAAKRIVDRLQAPERAAEAGRAAEEAERERLSGLAAEEERQVAERAQEDELASEEDLRERAAPLGEAIMAMVAAAIADSRAADRIAEQSELGEDSPLARDARRRADEAIRDAERAVEEAEREQERAAGKGGEGVERGFSIVRTITESSAGRLIGELMTSNHWLEKIYRQLGGTGGVATPAAAAAAAVPVIEVHVYIGDEEITDRVGVRMYQNFQHAAALNGNAQMGG